MAAAGYRSDANKDKSMISHDHSAIFVHIPKTAGQSVEQMFLDDLGLTWEERAPLLLRLNQDPNWGPERMAHLLAREYVELGHLTQAQFDRYYKFAVVRNPYDRLISTYRYLQGLGDISFGQFVARIPKASHRKMVRFYAPQAAYLCKQNQVIVDQIIPFEDLKTGVAEMAAKVFGEARALPKRNVSERQRDLSRDDIGPKVRDAIYTMYRRDFDLLGYHKDD